MNSNRYNPPNPEAERCVITGKQEASIKRLLLRNARYIGRNCYRYTSFLLAARSLSSMELEILERIFTMGLYADDVIDAACNKAFYQRISTAVEFNFLVCDVDNSYF
jgi:hypothetical protein